MVCAAVAFTARAQTVVLSDNFDSYSAGSMLAATSPLWITWSGAPSEDAVVSNAHSNSPPNSVYIIGSNGPTDLVLQFPANYTSGVYELEFKILIAPNKGAYFNLQGSTTPGVSWMLEAYFNNMGGGYINAGGTNAAAITYSTNLWNDVRIRVDLSSNLASFYMNNNHVYSWIWSHASDGSGASISWGGMNLYAAAAAPGDAEYYVDDIVLTDFTLMGIKENLPVNSFRLYPNPAKENFDLVYTSFKNTAAKIQIINSTGAIIYEENTELAEGTNRMSFSAMRLSPGIYFIRLITHDQTHSEKFAVEK